MTVAGLVVGALGIAFLWAAGVSFPTYPPPGLGILLAGTVLVVLAPWRWVPGVGAFLGLFVTVGFLISPHWAAKRVRPVWSERANGPGNSGDRSGHGPDRRRNRNP
jgi:hypothetical protein